MTATAGFKPNFSAKQYGKNLFSNITLLAVNSVIGILFTPYLIKHLGVAAYGLVPLINGITSYLTLITASINNAVGRHMVVAASNGEHDKAVLIFNTCLWGSIGLGVFMMLLALGATLKVEALINVPEGFTFDAQALLLTSVLCVAITFVSTPFSLAMFYSNRLDARSNVTLLNRIVYVVLAFGLIGFVTARPLMIGLAAVAGTVVAFVHTLRYWRLLTPWLKVRFEFSLGVLREFMEFSLWVMVNQLGNMIFLTADLIIVNRMIGPTANGVYAALLQLVILLRAFSTAVSSVFAPAIVHMYARNDFDALYDYCARSVRVMGFALIAPVAAICAFSYPLLRVWLGEEIAANSGLLFFMTFHMCFNLAALPLISAFQCKKRVRTLGLVTCLSGLFNVGVAVLLLKVTSLEMFAVAVAGMIAFTLRNSVFTPIYLAGWLRRPWYSLFFPILRVFLAVSAAVLAGRSFELFWTVEKLPGLAGNVALLTVLSLCIGWLVIFNADDRRKAFALASSYVKRQG
ncbi:hypothetical protein EPN96_05585 [bacterium]|nr:MAG: hypothetical protein EPN96_05585 [bacterium]